MWFQIQEMEEAFSRVMKAVGLLEIGGVINRNSEKDFTKEKYDWQ